MISRSKMDNNSDIVREFTYFYLFFDKPKGFKS